MHVLLFCPLSYCATAPRSLPTSSSLGLGPRALRARETISSPILIVRRAARLTRHARRESNEVSHQVSFDYRESHVIVVWYHVIVQKEICNFDCCNEWILKFWYFHLTTAKRRNPEQFLSLPWSVLQSHTLRAWWTDSYIGFSALFFSDKSQLIMN